MFTRAIFIVLTMSSQIPVSLYLQARLGLVQSWIVYTRLVLWTSCCLFIGKEYKFFVPTNFILVHLQVSGYHWNVQTLYCLPCSCWNGPGTQELVPFLTWTFLSLSLCHFLRAQVLFVALLLSGPGNKN